MKSKIIADVVLLSGGLSSFAVLHHLVKIKNMHKIHCVFTDTCIEDADLYRFLIESYLSLYFKDCLVKFDIPGYDDMDKRVSYIKKIRKKYNKLSRFHWLSLDKTPFDIFKDNKFMGNSRIDPCSKYLKRELSKKFIYDTFAPNSTIHFGLDHDEPNRIKKVRNYWENFKTSFPLAENLSIYPEAIEYLKNKNIEIPNLYKLGFHHNNCGGFCVKAGHKQFRLLNEKLPERYEQFANQEESVYNEIGKHPFLKKTKDKKTEYLTMREFIKEDVKSDSLEDSSCSCFL